MAEEPLPRSTLTLWALCVLAQTAASAGGAPVAPSSRLRLAMAWLTVAHAEGAALNLFWSDAREVLSSEQTEQMNGYIRGTALRLRLQGICERLGVSYWAIVHHAAALVAPWP